jgi:hypothetical protein
MSIAQKLKRIFGTQDPESMTLTELVSLVADEPTPANLELFYRRLLISKVGTRVPNPHGSIQPGTRKTTPDEKVGIPSTQDAKGYSYLLVFCNIPAMFQAFPQDTFAELDARVVLEMAKSRAMGVLVQNVLEKKQPWVGVLRADVADVLAGRFSTRR